jgi:hypothetical protein
MLPPGHIVGGYFTGLVVTKLLVPGLSPHETSLLLGLSAFFGFAPDLDYFIAFAKVGKLRVEHDEVNHRNFISHAPGLWLAIGLLVYTLSHDPFTKAVGLTIWLGSWSHFILDSFEYGIQWFWPFSTRLYALKDRAIKEDFYGTGFWNYWLKFLRYYTTRVSFYLELILIIFGIFAFIHLH